MDSTAKLIREWYNARNIAPAPVATRKAAANEMALQDVSGKRTLNLQRLAADIQNRNIETYVADVP
jgi:hypothetical protein